MKYRMYIDESGNPDLKSSDDPNHRYLGLTGIVIKLDHASDIVHPQLEALKKKYFPNHHHHDEPVILHRKELMNRKPPFESLKEDKKRAAFDVDLISMLSSWNYAVFTVCIDKKKLKDRYQWLKYPYHYCMEILLERYFSFLRRSRSRGDVMVESRSGKEDIRLKKVYADLYRQGNSFMNNQSFEAYFTSCNLKSKPKTANIVGIQIADLLAQICRKQLMDENNQKNRFSAFEERLLKVVNSKYDSADGRVFGMKFLP